MNLKGGKQELNVLANLMSPKLMEVTQAIEVGAAYKLNPIIEGETLTNIKPYVTWQIIVK